VPIPVANAAVRENTAGPQPSHNAVASLVVEERTYADADGKTVSVRVKKVTMLNKVVALIYLVRRLELAEQASRAHAAPAHAVGPGLMECIDALTAKFEQADAALAQRARDEISAALGCVPAESVLLLADNSAQAETTAPPVHAEPADINLFMAGKPCGPFSRARVQAMLDAGTVTLDTPSFRKVSDVWVPLGKLIGITSGIAAAQAAGQSAGDDYWSPGPGQSGTGSAGVGHRGLGVPPQRRGT
jgi:hypothetical protein